MINIMNEYVSYTKKSFHNYMKYILDKYYDKGIVTKFTDTYIDIRYSNYLENCDGMPITKKVLKGISLISEEMQNTLPEKKKPLVKGIEKIYKYAYNLDSLYYLDQHAKVINSIKLIREDVFKIEDENFPDSFDKLLKEDIKKKRDFLNNFVSDTFKLKKSRINKNSNTLRVDVVNSIKFPELYSDVAIAKAAEKDNIKEDILSVGYLLLTKDIIEELINNNFNNIYYIKFPKSIFAKQKKKNSLLNIIDNEYIIEHINLVVTFDCFTRYRTYIMELMHDGYQFTLSLDKTFDYSSDNLEYLEVFNNIFMLKDKYYYKDMLNNAKIGKRIIIVDEVE